VITAVHTLVYADDAEAARAFFRDVVGWPHVDAGEGWLIFHTGPSELGVHPTSAPWADERVAMHHEISLVCDDLAATLANLRARGVDVTQDVRDDGWGVTARIAVPGAGEMMIYEPRHATAYDAH
jgi:predicted enzyme related to lactoylglutathione lyase